MDQAQTPRRFLLVGDSLAVGLTSPLGKGGAYQFRGKGVTGSTAHDWVSKQWLQPELDAFTPDVVAVSLGTNDMKGGRADFGADVTSLLELISASGAIPLWIAPPKMPFDEGNIRSSLATALASFTGSSSSGAWHGKVEVFPSDARDPPYPRAADGIHMPPSGYQAWAQDLLGWQPLQVALAGSTPAGGNAGAIAAVIGGITLLGIAVGAAIYGAVRRPTLETQRTNERRSR